ncbi:cell wall protein [Nocardiopsis sp. NRRL B-16309]|uniref:cell wall protein n=1 Tax=Nocardiopsis sp. NRRL B-16309 TaxID=1519494 RepID=UPI001E56EE55|nr:cell wall protein [Nocardiopsis sp. NRRL B-16309]
MAAGLATGLPAAAHADESGESGEDARITTVDRAEGLDPEGDTVTVSGVGHAPGSAIEVTTWAVPAEAPAREDADEAGTGGTSTDEDGVADTDHAVTANVDERGAFTVVLDTGTAFAAEAGLDPDTDLFEIRLVAAGPESADAAPTGAPSTGGTAPEDGTTAPNRDDDGRNGEGAEADGDHGNDEDTRGTEVGEDVQDSGGDGGIGGNGDGGDAGSDHATGSDTDANPDSGADGLAAAPGPGRSAPVQAPAAPATAAVVGQVPVTFAAPAAAPRAQPQSQAPAAVPATRAEPELSVSKTTGLDPEGETVTVTGSGYDTSKGIYVALCDTSRASATQAPSPCIGGADMEGTSGSSVWVSSNPPPYGEGLAQPYTGSGTSGGFSVQLRVRADDANTDCTAAGTECAVVSRNDHTRSSDRGQDVFVPVTFAGQDGGSPDSGSGSDSDSDSDSGSGSGSGSGSTGDTGGGSGANGGNEGIGPLPTTGSPLWGLVLTALVATVTGATALVAARRRGGTATP